MRRRTSPRSSRGPRPVLAPDSPPCGALSLNAGSRAVAGRPSWTSPGAERRGSRPTSSCSLAAPGDVEVYLEMSLDYGPGVGTERLRSAVASVAGCSLDDVVVTHGAIEALLLSCAASLENRTAVAVAAPAYEGLFRAVEAVGGVVQAVPVWNPGASAPRSRPAAGTGPAALWRGDCQLAPQPHRSHGGSRGPGGPGRPVRRRRHDAHRRPGVRGDPRSRRALGAAAGAGLLCGRAGR